MTPSTPSAEATARATQSPAPSTGSVGISLSRVVKSYRQGRRAVQALRGVDLEIDGPGFYGIMGASGSGKSTLLHLLGGLDRPDSGSITVAGHRLEAMDEAALTLFRRRAIGIVFQQFNLLPTLDALGNVILPGVLDGRPRADLEARGLALLEELGLGARADHRPEAMSGGEQQRVAIARALLFEPGVLLADEPTGNLDSASADRLWTILREVASRRQMTVVVVTHEPVAASNCVETFVLRDGAVAGRFESYGLTPSELVLRAASAGR